ncbi:MAG: Ig-like domain-containing protein [Persicimonas sp.]
MALLIVALGMPSCALYEDAEALDQTLAVDDLEISPNPVRLELFQTTRVTATMYDRGDNELEGLEVDWSSSNESIATIDEDGNVEGLSTGDTTITARVGQQEASATVVVYTPVNRVEVEPDEAEVDIGGRLELSATAYGEDDSELSARTVEWSSADEDIATVDADGRVTGVAEGQATIRAAMTGVTGKATVTVFEPVDRVELTPTESTIEVTDTLELSAVVFDVNDQQRDDRVVQWSSSRPEVAEVDSSGLVEGLSGGQTTITAESGGESAEATITVEAPVADVELTPNPASVEVEDTLQMTAKVFDAADNELSGAEIDWESDDETVATVDDDGLVAGISGGEVTVTATSEGHSDTARVTVEDPVAKVSVSPGSLSLEAQETAQLTATLEDAAGNELTDRSVSWDSEDRDIARVDADGLVTARGEGVVEITATAEGVVGTAQVAVDNPVETVEVSPSAPTIEVTDTLQLSAVAKDSSGRIVSVPSFTWTSQDPQVVSVDSDGLIEGLEGGSASVTAQVDNVTATVDITVEDPVHSVVVSPSSSSVEVTETVQLSADLEDKAGNALSGRTVSWSSDDTDIATVDSTGQVTAVAGGTATITAESEGETGTAEVSVDDPVRSVEVTPDPASVDVGQTVTLTATPRDQGGNALSGFTITWSSNDTDIATVDSAGVASGVAEGSATISAAVDDGSGNTITGTAALTVGATVDSVTVTPQEAFIFPTEQAQLDASVEDANGNELTGRTVNWTSQDTNVATVDDAGLVTAQSVGTTTITAESEGVTDSATIDVVEWIQADVGRHYSCGVLSNNQGYCWGANTASGAIGDGTSDSSSDEDSLNHDADKTSPTLVDGDHSFATIRPGYYHTCGLTTAGEAYCWGHGGAGALGHGGGSSSAVPVAVSGGHTFAEIRVGANHTCARTASDEVYCWGANSMGQVGVGSGTSAFTAPQEITTHKFVELDVGANHSCGIEQSGDTYCWGSNDTGQLGDGTTDDADAPVLVSTSETFVAVDVGAGHSCGINASGEVYCWGLNNYGQLGDTTTTDRHTPVRAASGNTYDELSAGGSVSCGVTSAREVYCWGFNGQGNLGNGSFNASEPDPVRLSGSYSWDMVNFAYQHSCGLAAGSPDNYCWGDNEYGQIGDGTDGNDVSVPEKVLRP